MSGHSKWKTIKHKKAAADAKRSKGFTKLIKEITVAARTGGGDATGNPRLRTLLEKAKEINMPVDNAMRAIKKGTGELPGVHYESYLYEGYGPGGIAVLVEVLTDNKNKAIAELRHAFTRNNGTLAEAGAVNWMFERLGVLHVSPSTNTQTLTEDLLLEYLIDYDINDISQEETEDKAQAFTITCNPKELEKIKQVLKAHDLIISDAEVEWVAKTTHTVAENAEEKAIEFLEALDELEDVQNVYTNMN